MAEIAMILHTPLLDSQTAHLYLRGECHCQNCDNEIHNHGHHQNETHTYLPIAPCTTVDHCTDRHAMIDQEEEDDDFGRRR
jgi:hypothetical protein